MLISFIFGRKEIHKLELKPDIAERLRIFIGSDLFTVESPIAKSEYWKDHGDKLQTNISGNTVGITGDSGFYVPKQSSTVQKRITQSVLRVINQPANAIGWINSKVSSISRVPRLMSYEKAFDAVMRHDVVSDPDLSRFRINHRKLAQHKKVFTSVKLLKQHYQKWSGYEASANIIYHYYYQNIIRGFIKEEEINTVLEIGTGNGNFPAILYHDWSPLQVILVDLPETIAISIPFLSNLFPNVNILMPHEAHSGLHENFDFAFLTVDQLNLLTDNSIDLAINCHSFQEMTHKQIDVYFDLVQRVCRESGFFFTANRVEKIPCDGNAYTIEQPDPPNRFAEYPWKPQNEILAYEISRLSRLVLLDNVSIRLERIHK